MMSKTKEELQAELDRLKKEKERQGLERQVKDLKREVEPTTLERVSKGLGKFAAGVSRMIPEDKSERKNSKRKFDKKKERIRFTGFKF